MKVKIVMVGMYYSQLGDVGAWLLPWLGITGNSIDNLCGFTAIVRAGNKRANVMDRIIWMCWITVGLIHHWVYKLVARCQANDTPIGHPNSMFVVVHLFRQQL